MSPDEKRTKGKIKPPYGGFLFFILVKTWIFLSACLSFHFREIGVESYAMWK